MALPSGATFAGYIVARRLGSSVTGEVYLVEDPRSSRWQALKVLSDTMSADPPAVTVPDPATVPEAPPRRP